MKVYQYIVNGENFIKGWQEFNSERPDKKNDPAYISFINSLINNPAPISEMNYSIKDEMGRLHNKSTDKNYKLIDNQIQIVSHTKTPKEIFIEKYDNFVILRRLIKGIENKNDTDYVTFKNDLLAIFGE